MSITVRAAGGYRALAGAVVLTALAAWALSHAASIIAATRGQGTHFASVYALAFVMLALLTCLAYAERPAHPDRAQRAALNAQHVVVAIPVYNEDPAALRACIASMLRQTRPPQVVHVVDDGSTTSDYADVHAWAAAAASIAGVTLRWDRKPNGGKRSAQGLVFGTSVLADYFVTVDSDSILDNRAIEEVLKPFADTRVLSVAGVVMAVNNRRNLLTRLTDLWFTVGQLMDRSAMSRLGCVLVNCGPLAAYRADLVRRHLDGYLHETFVGRRVEFSDDSMLTLYALTEGKAVQQPTAFALTLMPETVGHHLRQYLRWMRGATIRSVWRVRYLPLRSPAYWLHLLAWLQLALGWTVVVVLFVATPLTTGSWAALPWLLIVPVLIGYGQALRYLTVTRSDERLGSRLLTFALSPIATLWAFAVLRLVRAYGMATCMRTGWGTRQTVEITLDQREPAAA